MQWSWGSDKSGTPEFPIRHLSLYRRGEHRVTAQACASWNPSLRRDDAGEWRYRRPGPPAPQPEDFWDAAVPDWEIKVMNGAGEWRNQERSFIDRLCIKWRLPGWNRDVSVHRDQVRKLAATPLGSTRGTHAKRRKSEDEGETEEGKAEAERRSKRPRLLHDDTEQRACVTTGGAGTSDWAFGEDTFFVSEGRLFFDIVPPLLSSDSSWPDPSSSIHFFRFIVDNEALAQALSGSSFVQWERLTQLVPLADCLLRSVTDGWRPPGPIGAPVLWRPRHHNQEADCLCNAVLDAG